MKMISHACVNNVYLHAKLVNLLTTVILVLTYGSYMELIVLKNALKLKDCGIIVIHGLVMNVMILVKHATNKMIFLINANLVMIQLYAVMECSVAHKCNYVYSLVLCVILEPIK